MDGKTVQTNLNEAILWRQGNLASMRPPNELLISAKVTPLQTTVKENKPKAYRSPLWAHLDEIHKWRLARETWEAIANKLATQYDLKISFQRVQSFFKRAIERDRRQPLGFGTEPSSSIAIQTTVAVAQDSDSIYENARKAIREEQQSRPPKVIKPDRLL
jgi:hypothetical protein